MTREQLAHLIRAAAEITHEQEFVVVGSQAILGQHKDPPEALILSHEADIYPRNRPDLADDIDGAIGELSEFHRSHGYYAEGVAPGTAKLPAGWEGRAFRLRNTSTNGATAICPEAHDLAASKLVAGREKDVVWVQAALDEGVVRKATLFERLRELQADVDPQVLDKAISRLEHMSPRPRRSGLR